MNETLALCEHHVPIKSLCSLCAKISFEKRISALEESYRGLFHEIKFLMEERDKGIERLKKLENFMPDVLQDFEKRLVKLEDKTSKDYFAALTSHNVLEKIKKIEQYMEMEDRITCSDVLNRLMKFEEKLAQKKDVFTHPGFNECQHCGKNNNPQSINYLGNYL